MNTQNTSLPFSEVFNIFIGLRAKAVAVSKSDYTMYSMRPKLSSNLRDFWQCIFDVARPSLPQFGDSVRAIALAIIIASHLILICKRNPAETALAGFEHPRSAPQHSVEILSVRVGCDVHVARPQFGDSLHATASVSIIATQLTCPKNNIRFSLRFKENQAARRVRKACFFWPQELSPLLASST